MKKNINFISFAFAFALVYRTQSGWSNHWNLQRARDCNCLSIEYSSIESIKGFAVNIPMDYFAIDIGNGNDNDENDDTIGRTVLFIIWYDLPTTYTTVRFHFIFNFHLPFTKYSIGEMQWMECTEMRGMKGSIKHKSNCVHHDAKSRTGQTWRRLKAAICAWNIPIFGQLCSLSAVPINHAAKRCSSYNSSVYQAEIKDFDVQYTLMHKQCVYVCVFMMVTRDKFRFEIGKQFSQ